MLGTSDGHVIHYRAAAGPEERPEFVRKKLVSLGRKSIDDVIVLPNHGKVLVLSGWFDRLRRLCSTP